MHIQVDLLADGMVNIKKVSQPDTNMVKKDNKGNEKEKDSTKSEEEDDTEKVITSFITEFCSFSFFVT